MARNVAANTVAFDIEPQPMSQALTRLGEQSGLTIIVETKVSKGVKAAALSGSYTPEEALEKLLEPAGLKAEYLDSKTVAVRSASEADSHTSRAGYENSFIRLAQADSASGRFGSDTADSARRRGYTAGFHSSSPKGGESGRESRIEEIIVTAQKREERLIDVPISISALSGGVLKERGIEDFADLSLAVPDLKIWDVGGAGNRGLFIRGVGNIRGTGSVVGMYIDEASITGSPLGQMDVRMYDLERVEVLRGPQGTLYGAGSMGGTVRFITKDPQFNRFVGKGEMSAAFMEDGDPSRRFKSAVNIPVVEDQLALRMAVTYEDLGGWIEQPAIPRSDINDQEIMTARLKALWQPSDALQVRAMAMVYRADTGALNHGEDADGNYTQPFGSTIEPTTASDYNLYNASLNYDFDAVRLTATSTYIDQFLRVQARGLFAPVLGPPPATPFAILYGGVEPDESESRTQTHEVRLAPETAAFSTGRPARSIAATTT